MRVGSSGVKATRSGGARTAARRGRGEVVARRGHGEASARRLSVSAAVVAMIVVAAPLTASAVELAGRASGLSDAISGIVLSCLDPNADLGAAGAEDVEGSIEEDISAGIAASFGATAGPQALPASFDEECFDTGCANEVLVSREGAVVGLIVDGSSDQVFSRLKDELVDGGWTWADGGRSDTGTFLKDDGTYRWLYVSCVGVAGATSVVVQVEKADR